MPAVVGKMQKVIHDWGRFGWGDTKVTKLVDSRLREITDSMMRVVQE